MHLLKSTASRLVEVRFEFLDEEVNEGIIRFTQQRSDSRPFFVLRERCVGWTFYFILFFHFILEVDLGGGELIPQPV